MLEHHAENRKPRANRYNCNHLHDWQDISDEFKDGCLLLGNGASIAIDERFGYSSLFDEAVRRGHLSEVHRRAFDHRNTWDFEEVLRGFRKAVESCREIGEEEKAADLEEKHSGVRQALIDTITDIHPSYWDVSTHFQPIASFLRSFRTVLSLNYDLIVYWATLSANGGDSEHEFKDCFISDGTFSSQWKKYRRGKGRITLLFYPHGNLCLVNDGEVETKVKRRRSTELLDMIGNRWRDGATPIFVSEGNSSDKQRAIEEHQYTRLIRDEVYSDIKTSLVIYGCSLGENDDHILESLFENRIERVAVSVWAGQSKEQQVKYCDGARAKLEHYGGNGLDITFFDSESEGCWIHRSGVQKGNRGPKLHASKLHRPSRRRYRSG